jgi:two-component system sensor histidine kinase PilS (NtrC family)
VTREFSREEYSARLRWLIWSRVALTTFLIGTLIFFQQRYRIYSFHVAVLYYLLFSVYFLSALYRYLLGTIKNLPFLGYLQISIDIFLVTFLVHLTGGIDSGFSVLYHLAIISSSIILSRRGGYLAASFASILYGSMLDLQYYNALFFVRSQNYTAAQVLYQVFITIVSFYIVALLSGYLTKRLQQTHNELREKSIDFDDLRVLQEHILKSVGSGILTTDLDGNITSWNPAAEQITGYSYDDIKNNWQDVFGNSIQELFGHTNSLKERPYRFDGWLIKKDGNPASLGMTASLLKDEMNTVRGVILTFQDITKILEMEEHIRRQERLATVGSLAAGIAHEIRNPLAALSGSIQVLQGELNLQDDNKRLMDIVVNETDRLNTIITEFLEYARPASVQTDQIELKSLLDETIKLLENSKNFHQNIDIRREIDPRLVLRGDSKRLRQVFWNLLINACQAMSDGGIVTITAEPFLTEEVDAAFCQITVFDTGSGINGKDLRKIFDPFFTTKEGGTGLGLSIAHRIIDDHGGGITVESEPGKGTQFKIKLPMIGNDTCLFTGTMQSDNTDSERQE